MNKVISRTNNKLTNKKLYTICPMVADCFFVRTASALKVKFMKKLDNYFAVVNIQISNSLQRLTCKAYNKLIVINKVTT